MCIAICGVRIVFDIFLAQFLFSCGSFLPVARCVCVRLPNLSPALKKWQMSNSSGTTGRMRNQMPVQLLAWLGWLLSIDSWRALEHMYILVCVYTHIHAHTHMPSWHASQGKSFLILFLLELLEVLGCPRQRTQNLFSGTHTSPYLPPFSQAWAGGWSVCWVWGQGQRQRIKTANVAVHIMQN